MEYYLAIFLEMTQTLPFWLGVLITAVVMLFVMRINTFIAVRQERKATKKAQSQINRYRSIDNEYEDKATKLDLINSIWYDPEDPRSDLKLIE